MTVSFLAGRPKVLASWLSCLVVVGVLLGPLSVGLATAQADQPSQSPSTAPQPIWTTGNGPDPRYGASMAYDTKRGVDVLFGGDKTWCCEQPRKNYITTNAKDDTWIWDGHEWIEQIKTGDHPERRFGAAMAYDPLTDQVVLFGGSNDIYGGFNDTWVWSDATHTWTHVHPQHSPGPRWGASMAWDGTSLVLFGGVHQDESEFLHPEHFDDDTWVWENNDWVRIDAGADHPSARTLAEMAYDGQEAVLTGGGEINRAIKADTWVFRNKRWTQVAVGQPSPNVACGSAATMPSGGALVFGGTQQNCIGFNAAINKEWRFDPISRTWSAINLNSRPPAEMMSAMAQGPNNTIILHGGTTDTDDGRPGTGKIPIPLSPIGTSINGDTWITQGGDWTSNASPPARYFSTMAYDPQLGGVVLYGGAFPNHRGGYGDIWLNKGSTWRQVAQGPTNCPDNPLCRWGAAMGYDSATHQLVMSGGANNGSGGYGDTYVFNGTYWQATSGKEPDGQACPAGPSARFLGVMAYDSPADDPNGQLLYFGGTTNFVGASRDLWQWDGSCWKQVDTRVAPPETSGPDRYGEGFAYAGTPGQVVMFGGTNQYEVGSFADTWTFTWATKTWTKVESGKPSNRSFVGMAFDPELAQGHGLVQFGGLQKRFADADGDSWGRVDNWTRFIPDFVPVGRFGDAMAFDPLTHKVVMFGGTRDFHTSLGDTWYLIAAPTTSTSLPSTTLPPTTVPSTAVAPTTAPPTTVAPTTVPPPTTAPPTTVAPTTVPAPPPPPTPAAASSCRPLSDGGNCYSAGEYCRASDHGASGVAGNGEAITCENKNGWRWEPS